MTSKASIRYSLLSRHHKCFFRDDDRSPSPTRAPQTPLLLLLHLSPTTARAPATPATTRGTPHPLEPQNNLRPEPQSNTYRRAEPGQFCVSVRRDGGLCAEEGDWDTGSGAAVCFAVPSSLTDTRTNSFTLAEINYWTGQWTGLTQHVTDSTKQAIPSASASSPSFSSVPQPPPTPPLVPHASSHFCNSSRTPSGGTSSPAPQIPSKAPPPTTTNT